MRKTKFQRLTAVLLCLMFVMGCFSLPTFAAEAKASSGNTSGEETSSANKSNIEEIRELLNAITYEEYSSLHSEVKRTEIKDPIVIDAVADIIADKTTADYKIAEFGKGDDKFTGVFTPSSGTVAWKVTIPETAKYTIVIEYYPIDEFTYGEGDDAVTITGKSADIERIFKVNDKVPFKEARYLTLSKNWVSNYADYEYKGKNTDEVKSAAEAANMPYTVNENGNPVFSFPGVWDAKKSDFCSKYGIRFMTQDINGNELRPDAVQDPYWMEYTIHDSTGYTTSAFEFVLEAGENTISLEGKNETMAVKSIRLEAAEVLPTYEEYMSAYKGKGNGSGSVKLESEFTNSTTDKTIYAIEDKSSAITSPADPSRTLLNTIGETKWQTAGQAISYKFTVDKDGLYDIMMRFRQNVLDGMYVNRALYIYSEGLSEGDEGYYDGIPFEEASALVYNFSDDWQVTGLRGINSQDNYKLFFKAGVTYTIKLEVTLGEMGKVVSKVQKALDNINNDYLSIIQLTGSNPSKYLDYGFSRIMPNVLKDMVNQAKILDNPNPTAKFPYDGVAQTLTKLAGQKSSNVGTLQKVADILLTMGQNEDNIARNLTRLKSYIGTLGTFLTDAQTQPLQLDYILVQSPEEEAPKAKANFWQAFVHEIKSFFCSFTRDYDSIGAMTEDTGDGVEVWIATGRDQFQVVRTLINNDFTPDPEVGGIPVDLKLVAAGTLLPSILANQGPDVYLGLGQDDVINYAIRSAVLPIEDLEGFNDVKKSFTEAAMLVLGIDDAQGNRHYYGLPETQSFPMMFVREDILAEIVVEIPETWEDVLAIIPALESKEMEIGLTTEYRIFLYQMGGELFADEGMRINLDSKVGLASFEKMCKMFTDYKFPYTYDAANRFRTGEMPILIGDYTGLYNQLKVFATEIEGMWSFYPLPGIEDENGNINNQSISACSATVLVKSAEENKHDAWKFMKWYTGKDCQSDYTNEMVAIMGPSAKHPTANINALESLPWTADEYKQIKAQIEGHDGEGGIEGLAAVPNYPGAYIIGRYTNFAFLAAYNEKADPSESLLSYINTINKEITRKRNEFGLETLEQGQTLASKRLSQAEEAMKALEEQDSSYADLLKSVRAAIKSEDMTLIKQNAAVVASYLKDGASTDLKGDTINIRTLGIEERDMSDSNRYGVQNLLYLLSTALSDAARAMSTY